MREKPLQHDMFLYEFAVRMLGVLATILFTLLFFYGAVASGKSADTNKNEKMTSAMKTNTVSETTEFVPLGDMH